MNTTIKRAAMAALIAALPLSAQAMPVGPAPAASSDAGVTLVSGGCGPGFHRGPFMGCRPNGFMRPMIRRPVICRLVLLPLPHRVCR